MPLVYKPKRKHSSFGSDGRRIKPSNEDGIPTESLPDIETRYLINNDLKAAATQDGITKAIKPSSKKVESNPFSIFSYKQAATDLKQSTDVMEEVAIELADELSKQDRPTEKNEDQDTVSLKSQPKESNTVAVELSTHDQLLNSCAKKQDGTNRFVGVEVTPRAGDNGV